MLTAKGLAEAAQRKSVSDEGLTRSVDDVTLDLVVSVSGVRRDETLFTFDDELLDQQYRRFHNGF